MLNEISITAPAGMDGRGEIAVINNSASGNYVGNLFKSSGFGGAPVRVSKDAVPEGAGVIFGSSYDDARSFTLEVAIALASTFALSNVRYRKLCRAWYAMRGDALLAWTDEDGSSKQINFRREQPPSDPDDDAHVLLAGIANDPLIYGGGAAKTGGPNTSLPSVFNSGDADSPNLSFSIAPPSATCILTNTTTGRSVTFTGLNGGGTVTIDFKARTIVQGGASKYGALTAPVDWWTLVPGNNAITCTNAASISWRDSWLSS